jgi:hypothetical protein
VVTFNYDVGLDWALRSSGLMPNYHLEGSTGDIPLLKLHGSLNWAECESCHKIVTSTDPLEGDVGTLRLHRVQKFVWKAAPRCSCGGPVPFEKPVLVPPSWDKSEYRQTIRAVWKRAAQELAEATTIIICGYSIPESDSFFKYLYALGTMGDVVPRQFAMFDPDERVHGRFREMLGLTARPLFKAYTHHFEDVTAIIGGLSRSALARYA